MKPGSFGRKREWRRCFHDVLLCCGLKLILSLFRLLPYFLSLKLARLLGWTAFILVRRDRRRALLQIKDVLGVGSEKEARRLAGEVFARIGEEVVAACLLPLRDPGLARTVEVDGLAHLDQALAKGKGVIWLTGHVGNWELMAARITALGYPLRVISSRLRYPRVNRLLTAFRRDLGVVALVRGEETSREALEGELGQGRVLGLLVDQDTRCYGGLLPFMGRLAFTPLGPALLAVESGAPVVVGFIERKDRARYLVRISPPLQIDAGGPSEERARALMIRVNQRIEEAIRRDPAGWPWFHERWRRGGGEAPGG